MSLTKTAIIQGVAELTGSSKAAAKENVEAVFETIAQALSHGENVDIAGFGLFKIKETAARKGRNPATGESIDIPAGKKVTFKLKPDLQERL